MRNIKSTADHVTEEKRADDKLFLLFEIYSRFQSIHDYLWTSNGNGKIVQKEEIKQRVKYSWPIKS